MDGPGPLLGNGAHGQIDHLVDGLIGGENPMIARDLAQGHIDRLNGIGRVDHLANILWKGKQWDHVGPVGSPRRADTGREPVPFLGKQFQIELGFTLGTGGVDRFEVGRHRFHVLMRHVAQRISDQRNHAQLHPCLRRDRFNGFGQASQPIDTGNKDETVQWFV